MSGFFPVQMPPPKNWQDFENLCFDLLSRMWNDPNTQKNGRQGQPQYGVDIFGQPSNGEGYYGVQCKGKDNYLRALLTAVEVRSEIEKAKKFSPKLKCFIIATTASRDVFLQQEVRNMAEENKRAGLFYVHVLFWDDIVERLSSFQDIQNKYYGFAYNSKVLDLYQFWANRICLEKLHDNACYIPLRRYNIQFSKNFIDNLISYLCSVDQYIEFILIDERFRFAVENFNNVAKDLIDVCFLYGPPSIVAEDLYEYWVDVDKGCDDRGYFIEFRKWVLKSLFYNLILAANHIIFTKKIILGESINENNYIKFCHYDQNSVNIETDFPRYSNDDIHNNTLYRGLNYIESNIISQLPK